MQGVARNFRHASKDDEFPACGRYPPRARCIHRMMLMALILGLTAVLALALLVRRLTTPPCPRCRAREWDRRLCAPLLFCRRCATRVDSHGRAYN